jgi:hypothetical protein
VIAVAIEIVTPEILEGICCLDVCGITKTGNKVGAVIFFFVSFSYVTCLTKHNA